MKKLVYFIYVIFLVNVQPTYARDRYADSINVLYKKAASDKEKINLLLALSWHNSYVNTDSAVAIGKRALAMAKKIKWDEGITVAEYNLGSFFHDKGELKKAMHYYLIAKKGYEKQKNRHGIANSLGNIGNLYLLEGNFSKALTFLFKSLKIDEELQDKNAIASDLGNIGNVYSDMGDFKKALVYYKRASKLDHESGNKRQIANGLSNMGIVYQDMKQYDKALDCYEKARKFNHESGARFVEAINIGNIGLVYMVMGQNDKALASFKEVIKTDKEIGNKKGLSFWYGNIGEFYCEQKMYKLAVTNVENSMTLAKELHLVETICNNYERLATIDSAMGNYGKALADFRMYVVYRDSLRNEEQVRQSAQAEMQYNLDKREIARKAKQDKEKALQQVDKKRQHFVLIVVCCALGLVMVFAIFVMRNLRTAHKQKLLIQVQKEEVEAQKHLVDEKQKEILDSIHYAKRIQQSQMPTQKYIQRSIGMRSV